MATRVLSANGATMMKCISLSWPLADLLKSLNFDYKCLSVETISKYWLNRDWILKIDDRMIKSMSLEVYEYWETNYISSHTMNLWELKRIMPAPDKY